MDVAGWGVTVTTPGWVLRLLAVLKIRVRGCTRFECDTCRVFAGCPRWGNPKPSHKGSPGSTGTK